MKREKEIKLIGCIIKKTDLIKLLQICNKYVNSDLKIEFKEETLSGISCEELKNKDFNNLKVKEITLIGSCFEKEKQNYIYFSESYEGAYKLSFESNNDIEFLRMRDEFEKWVNSINNRKKLINVMHSWSITIVSFVVCFILIFWTMFILSAKYNWSIDATSIVIYPFIGVTFGFLGLLKYVYPKTEIDLGVNTHKKLRGCIWFFVTVILIPLLLNFLK